jgi:pimeloyl-ACP methyl ester carboxylesterase
LASAAGWQDVSIDSGRFMLQAFTPIPGRPVQTLRIYIEGDGLAWRYRTRPSADPTPINPIALKLALQDTRPAAYLARPCQYLQDKGHTPCQPRYWTSARYGTEVISATSQAINVLKQGAGARQLELVGYSGGGVVAALVAARRNDVVRLITVASNLDHAAWTRLHHISPLHDSLNPADHWRQLQHIPQLHLVGAEDDIVPPAIIESYLARFPRARGGILHVVDNFDHQCCWVQQWPALLTAQ